MPGPKQLQNLFVSNRRLNSTNVPLEVAVVDGSGAHITSFGTGGTQYTDGDTDGTITGTAILFEDDSTAQTLGVVNSTNPLPVTFTGSISVDTVVTVSTGSVRVHQSTYADLNVQAKIQDSSAVTFVGSTTRPSTGVQGLIVRTVLNDLQSTAFSTIGNNSTSSTIVSSAAGLRHKVYAYSITSTVQAVNTLSFASSLANAIWHLQLQSFSSGISGANLAVTPPAWLFATEAGSPLVFKETGTTGTYHLSFSYFSEA